MSNLKLVKLVLHKFPTCRILFILFWNGKYIFFGNRICLSSVQIKLKKYPFPHYEGIGAACVRTDILLPSHAPLRFTLRSVESSRADCACASRISGPSPHLTLRGPNAFEHCRLSDSSAALFILLPVYSDLPFVWLQMVTQSYGWFRTIRHCVFCGVNVLGK